MLLTDAAETCVTRNQKGEAWSSNTINQVRTAIRLFDFAAGENVAIEFFVTNEGFDFDNPHPRVETLGHFPVGGIVRAGHPLLSETSTEAKYPVVRSSWTGLSLPQSIHAHMLGTPNVVEDFGALAKIAGSSDAIWFSSPYAVPHELRKGTLRELPGHGDDWPRDVGIVMYTLERRSQSPWARSIKDSLRTHIRALAKTRVPLPRAANTTQQ